ncbi:MAG TPA: ThiF family adenylyltransferase [Verrucomicrobiae bacterium]|jgi:hypothetical protein|nr:ThiF family adenylyltransferase [Verrucomicrobiae bacterium]
MKMVIKIPREIHERAKRDLRRPHRFAGERVGFFSTRCTRLGDTNLVHCIEYDTVNDDHYVDDHTVGARIGSLAVTTAMSRSINDSVGQLHVHLHGSAGLPVPSRTDESELPPLARGLRNANGAEAHGWIILGECDAHGSVLSPVDGAITSVPPVSIVGFPTVVNRREAQPNGALAGLKSLLAKKRRNSRYSRQSFLGPNSDSIIAYVKVGIIGLGGGGSHIVQQLAHVGFKNFVFCDYDRIADSNLNRLVLGTRADVRAKRLKTEIARRVVEKLHGDAQIVGDGSRWEDMTARLACCDIVFGCVDTYAARRDLEAFCRRVMVPYVDVGMDVHETGGGGHEIDGQVIVSMPGFPCMHCVGFLNESVLGEEAKKYGAAGAKPQVVWSNGVLCSAAVGMAVDMFTDWSGKTTQPAYLSFKGSDLTLSRSEMFSSLRGVACRHYPFSGIGDPVIRTL